MQLRSPSKRCVLEYLRPGVQPEGAQASSANGQAEGPFPMETTYTWESAGENAMKMTLRNRGEPQGFSKLVGPLMAAAMRRANVKDLACIKALLEAS